MNTLVSLPFSVESDSTCLTTTTTTNQRFNFAFKRKFKVTMVSLQASEWRWWWMKDISLLLRTAHCMVESWEKVEKRYKPLIQENTFIKAAWSVCLFFPAKSRFVIFIHGILVTKCPYRRSFPFLSFLFPSLFFLLLFYISLSIQPNPSTTQ